MGDRVNIAKYFLLEPAPPEKIPKIRKNNLQMAITRPTRGLRSSSFAYPIQVGHAGAHGTGPDRFRAVPDDFLMKTFFEKMPFFEKVDVFIKKSSGRARNRSGPVP